MHYANFHEALKKWQERKKRIDIENMCILLTNWNGSLEVLERFDKLPFQNKIVFVNERHDEYKSSFYIRGWKMEINGKANTIWRTYNLITGERFIDQFDYVGFFNSVVCNRGCY